MQYAKIVFMVSGSYNNSLQASIITGLSPLHLSDEDTAKLIQKTGTQSLSGGANFKSIFTNLTADQQKQIRSNVPFYVRWFCSDARILLRYISHNLSKSECPDDQKNAKGMQKRSFFSSRVIIKQPHENKFTRTFRKTSQRKSVQQAPVTLRPVLPGNVSQPKTTIAQTAIPPPPFPPGNAPAPQASATPQESAPPATQAQETTIAQTSPQSPQAPVAAATVATVSIEENATRLANATELKFERTYDKSCTGYGGKPLQQKMYVLTDQDGREVEIKNFSELCSAEKLTTINMSGSGVKLYEVQTILENCERLMDADFSNCTNVDSSSHQSYGATPLNIRNCNNLASINLAGTKISLIRIQGCANLQNVNISGTPMEILQIENCASFNDSSVSMNANLRCIRIIDCTSLQTLDFSTNTNLRCLCLRKCANLKSITPPSDPKELRILDVSGCTSLEDADLTHCCEGLKVIQDDCPATITLKPNSAPSDAQGSAQQFLRQTVGENFDQYNSYADNIIFSEMQNFGSRSNQRPTALVPFMWGHHPNVMRVDRWDMEERVDTAEEANIYTKHSIPPEGENAYFARITGDYCLTCCPNLQNTANFFQMFAAEIGDGVGMLVDLHDGNAGDEYLTQSDDLGITDVQKFGDTIVIQNASLLDGYGKPAKKNVTIEVRSAMVHGKKLWHVRIRGLPDNYVFSTEVQQRINEVVGKIREENKVTVTVSHCNGGLGRGPTHMYMDTIERAAKAAREMGQECICDWANQKLPVIDGKINLAYVTRNMVLSGHAVRNVCGQSTGQFLQLEKFTEDIAIAYNEGAPNAQFQGAQTPSAQNAAPVAAAAVSTDENTTRLANATSLTFVRHDGTQYIFKDQDASEVTVKSSTELPKACPELKILTLKGCTHLDAAQFQDFQNIESIDFAECSRLGYVDVSNCPKLKTLILPHPLPPDDQGRASLIAAGSEKLIIPEGTWCLSSRVNQFIMRYNGSLYRYSASTGKLTCFLGGTGWHLLADSDSSPNPDLLPLRNPAWHTPSDAWMPVPSSQRARQNQTPGRAI
ncbi:MAG: hypothetical protein LBI34_00240 [Puniceicoccales bacterium]|jgi:hypothetical protein|nr:hypothetical protein [Puniceicoccales bacterium]